MANWFDNIPVPMDADGEVVPLTTKVVYDKDGAELTVRSFDFKSDGYNNGWTVFCALGPNFMAQPYGSQELHIHRPDSWERLLEDLDKGAVATEGSAELYCCDYFGADDCEACPASEVPFLCGKVSFKDVADRIRALRGEGE